MCSASCTPNTTCRDLYGSGHDWERSGAPSCAQQPSVRDWSGVDKGLSLYALCSPVGCSPALGWPESTGCLSVPDSPGKLQYCSLGLVSLPLLISGIVICYPTGGGKAGTMNAVEWGSKERTKWWEKRVMLWLRTAKFAFLLLAELSSKEGVGGSFNTNDVLKQIFLTA